MKLRMSHITAATVVLTILWCGWLLASSRSVLVPSHGDRHQQRGFQGGNVRRQGPGVTAEDSEDAIVPRGSQAGHRHPRGTGLEAGVHGLSAALREWIFSARTVLWSRRRIFFAGCWTRPGLPMRTDESFWKRPWRLCGRRARSRRRRKHMCWSDELAEKNGLDVFDPGFEEQLRQARESRNRSQPAAVP